MRTNILTVRRDNGDIIPLPTPEEYSWNIDDLDAEGSGRAKKSGNMFRDRIASKRKLSIVWGRLNAADTSKILTAVSDVFFYLTYPDAQSGGFREMQCYVGTRNTPKLYVQNGSEIYWDGLSFNVVER